jgi:hypothetical protein
MPESPANDDLSAYLDGELPPEASARVQRALASDPVLVVELEQLRLVRSMLSKHGRVDAPFGFKARVLAAVADEPAPTSTWKTWLRRPFGIPVEGFAVALAALLVVVVVGNREQAGDGAPLNNFEAPIPAGEQVIVNPERDAARAQQGLSPIPASEIAAPFSVNEGETDNVTSGFVGERLEGISVPSSGILAPDIGRPVAPEPTTVGVVEPSPAPVAKQSGTADDDAPALFGASYRYQVSTSDPDAATQLLRLAGRYRGRVLDSSGRQVTATQSDSGSYRVQVPAEHLAEFGSALRALGSVVERPDDRIFASSSVTIQVDLIQSGSRDAAELE